MKIQTIVWQSVLTGVLTELNVNQLERLIEGASLNEADRSAILLLRKCLNERSVTLTGKRRVPSFLGNMAA